MKSLALVVVILTLAGEPLPEVELTVSKGDKTVSAPLMANASATT
jgi:hypothetical protein